MIWLPRARVQMERQEKGLMGMGHKGQLLGWPQPVLFVVLGSDDKRVCRALRSLYKSREEEREMGEPGKRREIFCYHENVHTI